MGVRRKRWRVGLMWVRESDCGCEGDVEGSSECGCDRG